MTDSSEALKTTKMSTKNNGKFFFHFVCDFNGELWQNYHTKIKTTEQKIYLFFIKKHVIWLSLLFCHFHSHSTFKNILVSACKFFFWTYWKYECIYFIFIFPDLLTVFVLGFSKNIFTTHSHRIIFEFCNYTDSLEIAFSRAY